MVLLYQNSAIRQCEAATYAENDLTAYDLMLRAGRVTWDHIQHNYAKAKNIIVCCGKGNNGGDGLVVARLAHEYGVRVRVMLCEGVVTSEPAQQALQAAESAGVVFQDFDAEQLQEADLLVDALLGSGVKGELREPYINVVNAMNAAAAPIVAVDIATGLDADTAAINEPTIHADSTITFIGNKPGLLTGMGVAVSGKVFFNDLAIPHSLLQSMQPCAETLAWEHVRPNIKRRCRNSHKGHHGHVLVIGGDYGMGGAVRLSAEAALRAGAGLVTVATRPEHVPIVSGTRPELMCYQVSGADDLQPLIDACNVIIIGPGLGKSSWAEELLQVVLSSDIKTVYDADALNLISTYDAVPILTNSIMTPHPGEAARLLGCTNSEVQSDRFAKLQQLISRYQSVAVLKGAGSLIGCSDVLPKICKAGNPGMATAGMGDVLTGVIGAFLAQGMSLYDAACAGVLVHSWSADVAAKDGGERGLLATDLLDYIRDLVNPDAS
jgi:ADP-dependent NAD(P)H-hydrate dehydratase / NAD(P)H-hydrate epimerase